MTKPKCISLFSGAGGLDIGIDRAGFDVVLACDVDTISCKTLEMNKGHVHADGYRYFENTRISSIDLSLAPIEVFSQYGDIDCIIGGPPCQSFSSAGNQRGTLDPRGDLVRHYIRLVKGLMPKCFLFENVRGLVTARDNQGNPGGIIKTIFNDLQAAGYSCRAALLNSADYGSYQRRVRCFILGVRHGVAPEFPCPTHFNLQSGSTNLILSPWRTLGEFLELYSDKDSSNWTLPSHKLKADIEQLADGSGLKSMGVSEPTRPGGHWGYKQGTFIADKNKPSRTVTGSASQDFVRWDGILRRLTLLEVTRLQGFPDDWIFCGNKTQVFKQIGNAVPTIFGEVIGKRLIGALNSSDKSSPMKLTMPDKFDSYINYTIKDHQRNKSARRVHLQFS